jgi:saccharopine dehydrogenase (NAD+, L-lysine forming)
MEKKVKVGLIRETKIPPDRRVPLTPAQVVELKDKYPVRGILCTAVRYQLLY